MTPEVLTLVSALSGAFIGSLSTLAVTWVNKRYDDKRARRDLVVSTAVANWKQAVEIALRKQGQGQKVSVPPVDDFIIHMLILSDRIIDKKMEPEKIKEILAEIDKLLAPITEFRTTQK